MNGSCGSDKGPNGEHGDRAAIEAPRVPQSQESQPWKWRPEYWERYWRQVPGSSLDPATAS